MFFRHCLINSQGNGETANIVLEFRKLAAIHIFQIVFNHGITFSKPVLCNIMGNKLRKLLPGRSTEDESVTGKEGTYTEKHEVDTPQETGTSQTEPQNENTSGKMSKNSDCTAGVKSESSASPPPSNAGVGGEASENQQVSGGKGGP